MKLKDVSAAEQAVPSFAQLLLSSAKPTLIPLSSVENV